MNNQGIRNVNAPLKAIYRPKGEALENAPYGLNIYGGCSHKCRYCYNQYRFHRSCNCRLKKATLENIEADLKKLDEEMKTAKTQADKDAIKKRQDELKKKLAESKKK